MAWPVIDTHNGSVHPPPRAASTTDQPPRFDVLVVGTMNVCRSPAAERLLRARFRGAPGVTVSSAGTHARLEEKVPEPVVDLLDSQGVAIDGHTPRELDAELVRSADLVLATSREARTEVVRLVPGAVRRTFTLRELARLVPLLEPATAPDADVSARLTALTDAAAMHRRPPDSRVVADDDVLDPYGRTEDAYEESFDQVVTAVDTIAQSVLPPAPVPEAVVAPSEPPGPPVRPGRSKGRTIALVAFVSVLSLVVALTLGALVVLGRFDSRIQRFPDPFAGLPTRPAPVAPQEGEAAGAPPVTILVIGSTADVGTGEQVDWEAAAARTDAVMLAHVSGDRRSAQLISLPPDLWVEVPGSGPGPLRDALALGGPTRAVQTVEQLTDVRVDHVALTGSATFAGVTDSLDGVDVEVARDLVVDERVVVAAGDQRLSGEEALLWVHGGDDQSGRAQRQEEWLRAILDRVGDSDVRGDPAAWLELTGVVSGSVAVDEGFDRGTMVGLLTSARSLRPGDVEVVPVPTTTGTAPDGTSVLVPDAEPFAALMDALRNDTLSEHLAEAPS